MLKFVSFAERGALLVRVEMSSHVLKEFSCV